MSAADPNPEYWAEYSNLQHTKHMLIKNYLQGWFPKMALGASGRRRLNYVDTHAGRGRYMTGQLGSPLVALTTLLNHSSLAQILQNAEIQYLFFERDAANVGRLREELASHTLPANVRVFPSQGDTFDLIEGMLQRVEENRTRLAPGFFFVDPYGFHLPGRLLRRILDHPGVELFVNVIWRQLDMGIQQGRVNLGTAPVAILNSVFDGEAWKTIDATDADERAEQCAALFRTIIGARWGTHIRMMDHGRVKYFLLHLTNSDDGRDLMKECIWKSCPQGGYYASKSDDPRQRLLIEPEPDFRPLREWVREKLAQEPKRWKALQEDLREELWLDKLLNDMIRKMRQERELDGSDYTDSFNPSNNPLLRLLPSQRDLFS